ncbi:hypothetical protein GCM10027347_58020 [Larkinella harenae]
MRYLLFFLGTLLAGGCIRSVDELSVDVLPIDRVTKPYVICFISPQDTVIAAKVAMSEPRIVSSFAESLVVKDAVVLLSDSSQSIQLVYNDKLMYYRAVPGNGFRIRSGGTYRLTVSMSGNRSVTAEATVPEVIPLEGIAIDSTVSRNSADAALTTYTTTLSWSAPAKPKPGQPASYYRGWAEVNQTVVDAATGLLISRQTSRPAFYLDRETGQIGERRFINGTHTLLSGPQTGTQTKQIVGALFTTDENYYRYHIALREQFVSQGQYFAEPTVLFSNIVGGYGVFAAYNGSYLILGETKRSPR